ncbi:hypothetical protein ACSBR1_009411 [Camellia fascicularis]
MRRELFLRILNDVKGYDKYFVQKKDCVGRLGCSPIQKITAAIHILAYGFLLDHCDECIKIGETIANDSLKLFCNAIIALYEEQYLCSSNENDIARLLEEGKSRGFPGMLGSLDCMHWEWKNCSIAWHGTYRGYYNKPTLILEVVASKDLCIWDVFFGMSGSHNDVNVLDHSLIFDNLIHGNEKLFAQKQEAIRKDVERAFGVLQTSVSSVPLEIENQTQKPQPNMFQNMEISKLEVCAVGNSRKDSAIEWFFDNSYTPVNPIPIIFLSVVLHVHASWRDGMLMIRQVVN